VRTEDDADDLARLLAGAFHMPVDAVRRTLPHTVTDVPGLDVFLARVEDESASTVTVTRHDRIAGIWAMGTPPDRQGQGLGKILLSQVMDRYRGAGVEAFFLGATPAGRPLYEKLGYREVARAQVWVRGETHQA
jgi:GNAT superfamily N-acetyltransferase